MLNFTPANDERLPGVHSEASFIDGDTNKPALGAQKCWFDELEEIRKIVAAFGYAQDRIRIDPSVVRGLEYYTGPVYEVELLLETKDEKGRPVRFGSVGGGGRYDGLVSRFRGEPVPATGFSIGVSRLQAALTMLGKIDTRPAFGPVVVTVFGGEIAGYQQMVATLRDAGIRAELYLGNPKHSLGQQMKYADRRNAPVAIVQGSDEKANGKVQIKDLILGAGLTEIKDREEYLKKQTEAQYEVEAGRLVEVVREVLARHDVKWGKLQISSYAGLSRVSSLLYRMIWMAGSSPAMTIDESKTKRERPRCLKLPSAWPPAATTNRRPA